MRISTNTIYEAGSARLSDLQARLVRQQEQIATGRRMLTPADDPVAAARALEVTQSQSTNTQYGVNRQNAKDSLSQEESSLQSVTDIMYDVKSLTVNAGNGTLSDTDRKSLATQLQGQYDALLGLANSKDGTGTYLFGGYQTTSQPFNASATGAPYAGDQGQRLLQVGPTQKMSMSDTGSDVFERNRTGNGVFSTAAVGTNTGSGVISAGSVVVPTGNGTSTPAVLSNFSFGQPAVPQVDGTSNPKTVTSFNFSLGAVPQVDGTSNPQAVTSFDFSQPSVPQVDGTSTPQTVTSFDFSAPAVPVVGGTNVQNTISGFDFSGANLAQFDVNGQSVTLTTNTVDETGLAAAIQAQLTGITVTGVNGSGTLTFTDTSSPAAVAITNSDVNANTAGFADSAGTAGSAATPAASANFAVDGTPITLNGADTDINGVAAELTAKMQASPLGANYSASVVAGQIVITQAGSTAAVAITGADANAVAAGINNSAGVAGAAAVPASDATFSVDGTPITLNGADTDINGVAAELTAKMQASPLGANYSASVVAGKIVITQAGSLAAVAITGADADAVAAGIANTPGIAGTAAVPPSDATFSVDGTPITLNGADTDINGVAAELTAKMQASPLGANYSASVVAGQLVITHAGSTSAVAITGADADAVAAGITNSAGVAGAAAIPTTNATFSVDGTPITLNGNDTNAAGVAAEINTKIQASGLVDKANYNAAVVNGKLVITHTGTQAAVAISGADANAIAAGITNQPGVPGNAVALTGDQYRIDFAVAGPGTTTYSVVDTTTGLTLSAGNPYTSGQSISFDGLQFDIKGNPANGDQFTVQPSVNQSLFTTLKTLIGVLNTPTAGTAGQTKFLNGLNTAQDNLSNALDNILTVRSTVGSRLNSIDTLDSNGSDKDLQYSTTLSQLQDLDYTKAITQLTQQQTTLSAAQQSFVKISGLSLFNYL